MLRILFGAAMIVAALAYGLLWTGGTAMSDSPFPHELKLFFELWPTYLGVAAGAAVVASQWPRR